MINLINQKLANSENPIFNQIVWEWFLKNQLKKGNDITHFYINKRETQYL